MISNGKGDVVQAVAVHDESWEYTTRGLALLLEVGDRRCEAWLRGNLGVLHHRAGRWGEARETFALAKPILREANDRYQLAMLLGHRAALELDAGEADTARAALIEAEAHVKEIGAGPGSEPGQLLTAVRARSGV